MNRNSKRRQSETKVATKGNGRRAGRSIAATLVFALVFSASALAADRKAARPSTVKNLEARIRAAVVTEECMSSKLVERLDKVLRDMHMYTLRSLLHTLDVCSSPKKAK